MMGGRGVYFNEIDPAAAHVLRALIADGALPRGEVDTRSIADVQPDDLHGFDQCHFFAGFGGWSLAARLAGWSDDRPLWSGSCPCQPFSQAGKGAGREDPRHLWPDLYRLAAACRPACVVGEQVAGAAGYDWFDGVAADLGGAGYACRAVDIPAAAVDAPHIRQRLYWVALADSAGDGRQQGVAGPSPARYGHSSAADDLCDVRALADADRCGRGGWPEASERGAAGRIAAERPDGAAGVGVTQGDAERARLEGQCRHGDGAPGRPLAHRPTAPPDGGGMVDAARFGWREGRPEHELRRGRDAAPDAASPQRRNGSFWSGADWLACHDGKARRAKSGLRLLADGMLGRVDAWRLAGNGLVLPLATEVVGALMDYLDADARAS